jgi:hypothetical protein
MSIAHWQAGRLPIPAAWPARSSPAVHAWAIIPAGLAPVLLTGGYLVAGALQPASYSPVRKTISVMAGQAGTDRWIMTGGIFLVGGCYLVTAAGLTGVRAAARVLLILAGLAGIGIAASPVPASGATPRHLAWTVLGAVTIAVWPAFAARRASPRPLILSVYGSAAVTAVFVALLGWLFIQTRDGSVLGLAERLTSSVQTCWPFIVAVTLRRARRPPPASGPQRPGPRSGPGSAHRTSPHCTRWRPRSATPGPRLTPVRRPAPKPDPADKRSPEPGTQGPGHSPPRIPRVPETRRHRWH